MKTHPGDKSCNLLSVCIKQLDATFSDCMCSCAPFGINGCQKSNPKFNKHQFSSWKSTLKTHPGDKSCSPLRVCIEQLDAMFSDCLGSRAPFGILFSRTIIEDFLRNLCILRIFSTMAYICFQRAYHIRSTFASCSALFGSSMLTESRVCSFLSTHRLWVGMQSSISKEYSRQSMLNFFNLDEELPDDQQEQIWNQKLDNVTRNCILTCTHKNTTFDIGNPCVLCGILLCIPATLCGFPFLCQGCIMFHVLRCFVANCCYQFNNYHHDNYQRMVKLKYSTNFFIHPFFFVLSSSCTLFMVIIQSVLLDCVCFLLVFGTPLLAQTCFLRPFPMSFLLLLILHPSSLNQGVVHKRNRTRKRNRKLNRKLCRRN